MNLNAILTKREREIASFLAWGATKKEVAARLNLSERTIENHSRNIYHKVCVDTVNALSAWWFCTEFKISIDLSPRKRSIIAAFMLLVYSGITLTHEQGVYTRRINIRRNTTEIRIKD